MCTISVTTTLEEYNVYIEESDNLLYANEGGDPEPVAHAAWDHMRQHPENEACALHVQLEPALPPWRVRQVIDAVFWLVCQIIRRRIEQREVTQ